ncbi:MAG: hypothetical protein QOG54_1065 [Actinomycetota bacterium]|jgi:hypothetical protein|nr:hypothetical protein [Actinomycetota bacterium]
MLDKALGSSKSAMISIPLALALALGAIAYSTTRAEAGAQAKPLPQGSEPANLDPADFVAEIDHPYWPMKPGTRWVYREAEQGGDTARVVVKVTDKKREIIGIQATVVHDVLYEHGEILENTWDWYAQDKDGNIWYLGEKTKEFDGKKVNTEGSWEAGVDGAEAGVALPANPEDGQTYRQEYYAGHAEDKAEILATNEWAETPYGFFQNVVTTRDFTAIEPKVLEHKFYALGVGPVIELGISGGAARTELLHYSQP